MPDLAIRSLGVALLLAGVVRADRMTPRTPERLQALLRDLGPHEPTPQQAARLDAEAAQKDAFYSCLYWHTDLRSALVQARDTGRPVLSLRLLGRLDEELSCANSRLFRTVLYANAGVSTYLREHYVLHWQSVRPAPKLTVDYGDGRTLTGTVTGNSVHYVLDADGRVVNALPGLYGPAAFVQFLKLSRQMAGESVADRRGRWRPVARPLAATPAATAAAAAPLARSKLVLERAAVSTLTAVAVDAPPVPVTDADVAAVVFDDNSLRLMRRKMPADADVAAADRLLSGLRRTIAQDQAQNAARLRPAILDRLLAVPDEPLERLNDWVYANVLATPAADAWLGLRPDAFTGIDNGGLTPRP